MSEQKRGRKIAMSEAERDEFLRSERTCRMASVGVDGAPHVSALWFVWDGTALWLNSVVRSQRWVNVVRDTRISALIDTGHEFNELRGVELIGTVEPIGEAPRTGEPNDELVAPEQMFGDKYAGGKFFYDGGHAWLRMVPEKVVSWDFRKMGL
jgi:Pyridoxamine 5'-phosphate oxidase